MALHLTIRAVARAAILAVRAAAAAAAAVAEAAGSKGKGGSNNHRSSSMVTAVAVVAAVGAEMSLHDLKAHQLCFRTTMMYKQASALSERRPRAPLIRKSAPLMAHSNSFWHANYPQTPFGGEDGS